MPDSPRRARGAAPTGPSAARKPPTRKSPDGPPPAGRRATPRKTGRAEPVRDDAAAPDATEAVPPAGPAKAKPARVTKAKPAKLTKAKPAELTKAEPATEAEPPGEAGIPEPRPAPRRPGLIPTDIADALARVLGAATRSIREREEGSRSGGDIENVHQMRVATRRIRAYLKAARPALDPEAAGGVRDDLKELADALGQVRDLDVMIARLGAEAQALGEPDATSLLRLIGTLDGDRGRARRGLIAVLDEPDHAALLAELDATANRPPVTDPWADLEDLAAAEWRKLDKAHRRLRREFGDDPPDDDLHALRILGKRARYTAELLPKSKNLTEFLAALAAFQEVLGDHQDAYVLEERLRELVTRTRNSAGALAAGRVIERCRLRRVEKRAAYPGVWRTVRRAADVMFSSDS